MSDGTNMVKATIDGNRYEFAAGTTILEAAGGVGIEIPHYCYHPGLSLAGACRMCLVEIEKMPKLQIACYMTVGEDMVVFTDNERVKRARKAMLEFHLVNHPLDCPVCDQAGECGLQIYYMQHGLYISRVRENKVKKSKKAVQIGPHVMLDQERCILCSRCVRFCNEIPKTSELGMFNRGDREIIDIFPDRELNNPYSANVIDICPVGALLSKDFLFKTRVWYLETVNSVCTRCSRGCNIFIDYNLKLPWKNEGRRLSRLRPRYNCDVNDWWMCDEGRFGSDFVDAENRIDLPVVVKDGARTESDWDTALETAALRLRQAASEPGEVAVLVSPGLSNEALYLLKKVLAEQLPGTMISFSNLNEHESTEDDILRKADKNPNTTGAEFLGLTSANPEVKDIGALLETAAGGNLTALVVVSHDPAGLQPVYGRGWGAALDKVPFKVYLGTNSCATSDQADVVLPLAVFAEREATVTNFAGRVQLQHRAFEPLAESLPDWQAIFKLGNALGGEYNYGSAEEVFDELAANEDKFAGLSYEKIDDAGVKIVG
ncbi:MAG: molybdopterin-dependent oxidoreductase [Candidatus Glassbacteria bacterium]|nr:molybdopterin-dependent oxidoreductase [Candidatus Glassbacteria bacterium]